MGRMITFDGKTMNVKNWAKKEMTTREVKLGVVGVDSGQLVICDPCYIKSEWKDNDRPIYHPVYRDTVTKKRWQLCFGQPPIEPDILPFPGCYETPIDECDGLKPNELVASGRWVVEEVIPPWRGEFSYGGCCDIQKNENQGGQLMYALGHAGAGVAFSSGLGDGEYDVYATIEKVLGFGERVTSVRIDLMSFHEEEK